MANDRVSQTSAEVVLTSDAAARISETSADVVANPTDATGRISETSADVVVDPTDSVARVNRLFAEAVVHPTSAARLSQVSLDVVWSPRENYAWATWWDGKRT